jgi:hypothetical protein
MTSAYPGKESRRIFQDERRRVELTIFNESGFTLRAYINSTMAEQTSSGNTSPIVRQYQPVHQDADLDFFGGDQHLLQ